MGELTQLSRMVLDFLGDIIDAVRSVYNTLSVTTVNRNVDTPSAAAVAQIMIRAAGPPQVCHKVAPAFGVRPREVKLGLGVALGLIALHRLFTAPSKQRSVARAAAGAHSATAGSSSLFAAQAAPVSAVRLPRAYTYTHWSELARTMRELTCRAWRKCRCCQWLQSG